MDKRFPPSPRFVSNHLGDGNTSRGCRIITELADGFETPAFFRPRRFHLRPHESKVGGPSLCSCSAVEKPFSRENFFGDHRNGAWAQGSNQ